MSAAEITARVERAFVRVFGSRLPFSAQLARADDDYWTSLKHMELLLALEDEFGLRFDGADATDMTSVPVIIERLGARLP